MVFLALAVISLSLAGCDFDSLTEQLERASKIKEATITEEGFNVFTDIQPNYYGADPGKPVALVNNENAVDPTWQQLKTFIMADTTDENEYLPGIRVCSEFAAELHNNAETAGIRAAWVALDFEDDSEGHALNAFETTDRGLVFIDCTGGIPSLEIPAIDEETGLITEESRCFDSHDKIAYVRIGSQCGFIGLDISGSFEYESYLNYVSDWGSLQERYERLEASVAEFESALEEYNLAAARYEALLGGRTVIKNEKEYELLNEMRDELEKQRLELEVWRTDIINEAYVINNRTEKLGNCRREPLGIVSDVEIYW